MEFLSRFPAIWFILIGASASAALAGVLLPARAARPRLVHAVFGLLVAALAVTATGILQARGFARAQARTEAMERQAAQLLDAHYSPENGMRMALAFLEKHRDLVPEAYAQARQICPRSDCMVEPPGLTAGQRLKWQEYRVDQMGRMLSILQALLPPPPADPSAVP